MGLLSSGGSGKKFDKHEKLTSKKGKEILSYMDKRNKGKVKEYLRGVSEEEKSINQVAQEIQEDMGSGMKRKFMHAAKKYAGGGLTQKEKRRNLAKNMQDRGSPDYESSVVQFAGGKVATSHRVSMKKEEKDEKSTGSSGFAQGAVSKRSTSIQSSPKRGGVTSQGQKGGGFAGGNQKRGPSGKKGGGKPIGF